MNNTLLQQIGLSFRIWIIAVLINTGIGTIFLAMTIGVETVPLLLLFGTFFGMIVSSPALVINTVIINVCMRSKLTGAQTYRILLGVAACLGLAAWVFYMIFFKDFNWENYVFLAIAILSAITAVSTQHRKLIGVDDYSTSFETE